MEIAVNNFSKEFGTNEMTKQTTNTMGIAVDNFSKVFGTEELMKQAESTIINFAIEECLRYKVTNATIEILTMLFIFATCRFEKLHPFLRTNSDTEDTDEFVWYDLFIERGTIFKIGDRMKEMGVRVI